MTSNVDDSTAKRLTSFIEAYHAAINVELDSLAEPYTAPYRGRTSLAAAFWCSDGAAVFYLSPPAEVGIPPGVRAFDCRGFTLNQVCQSLHLNRLQIIVPELGVAWDTPFELVADQPPIPGLAGLWFSDEVRQAVGEHRIDTLPGLSIVPILHVEAGIRRSFEPGRMKLWSPLIDIPGIGVRRAFLWSHADIWWMPSALKFGTESAVDTAAHDMLGLRTLLSAEQNVRPLNGADGTSDAKDAGRSAADILDAYCDELNALIDDPSTTEEVLHQWLADERHRVFLDPHAKKVWSKLPFGKTISDFVVRAADGSYTLVEIERASVRIMQQGNNEPTAPFNHACQQVRDWRRYIRDNVQTVRHELGLHDIYEPAGKVIIGRAAHIEAPEALRRWNDLKQSGDLGLATYDQVVASVRQLAARHYGRCSTVVQPSRIDSGRGRQYGRVQKDCCVTA